MNRRNFLRSSAGLLIPFAAPAIVKAGNLMPVKALDDFEPRWITTRNPPPLRMMPIVGDLPLIACEEKILVGYEQTEVFVSSTKQLDRLLANNMGVIDRGALYINVDDKHIPGRSPSIRYVDGAAEYFMESDQ